MLAEVFAFVSWSGLPPESLARFGDWDFVDLTIDGELAAVAALKGFEIHFAAAPKWRRRLMTRRRVRDFLGPLFEERGFLTTRVDRASATPATYDFLWRLGFEHTARDEATDYFMMSELPYGRADD